jgi:hypothetical protein
MNYVQWLYVDIVGIFGINHFYPEDGGGRFLLTDR